jgi:hypothetical protein
MIFRDVQLVNGGKHSNQKLEQNRYLMKYWDNVQDIFCTFLPNKVDFRGIAKLNVYLGDFEGEEYLSPSTDGIASYRRNDFSYSEFANLTETEKNVKSLYYIEDSILRVGEKLKVPNETLDVLKVAANKVLNSNFEIDLIHKKTTKWNKSRNLRVVTTLHHKVNGIDVDISLLNKEGVTLCSHKVESNQIWNSVWFNYFKGSWDGSAFIVEDRVGEETFKLETTEFQVT